MLAAVSLFLAIALALVQLGSDAIFARAGEPQSLPARLPRSIGTGVYERLARVAPAPYVDAMLARAALDGGNPAQALAYAKRMPDSANRDDLLGEAAVARGDARSAQRYFVRAGDIEAIAQSVDALARRDPAAAYDLELALARRLQQSGTHPDAVAEANWRLGQLAWLQSKRSLAMRRYEQALTLSPISEKYLLSAGFAAYDLNDDAAAQRYFARVLAVNPASADAYAGAGLIALRAGDRARAVFDARRARAVQANSHALETLEAQLRP